MSCNSSCPETKVTAPGVRSMAATRSFRSTRSGRGPTVNSRTTSSWASSTVIRMTVDEAQDEVVRLLSVGPRPERVDLNDLVAAIERTPGAVTFVSGQEELQLILAYPFAAWRTFLYPSQHKIAYRGSYAGPTQVTGGPGTGKTVTVLHRAAFLAKRAGRVLVTTFNGNLAGALRTQSEEHTSE